MSVRGRQQAGRGWAYLDLASLGVNTGRSYLSALLWIVLLPLAAAALLGLLAAFVTAPGLQALLAGVLLPYAPIVVAGAATVWSAVDIHRRPWRSLVAADLRLDWARLGVGLGVQLAILGGELALLHLATGWPWHFSLAAGLPVLLAAMLLIPLQAASEEIVFRGYLSQALARRVRSRVAVAVGVAALFGLAHVNAHGALTLPYFGLLSLVFSLVSLRDEGLELAIGGHAAINLFGFVAANAAVVAPAAATPAALNAGAVALTTASLAVPLINGALFYVGTRLLVRLLCRPRAANR
ncbi:MAG: lysostaphin resistance A-like protein [Thiohalocapsa sp.]